MMAAFAESITVEDLERDPYPIYERLRDDDPVAYVPSVGLWLVTRWDDVQHIATHPELFTAEVDSSPLARTLGVDVVAEGVETEEQAQLLSSMSCSHAQGYYFARPMSAADVTATLSRSLYLAGDPAALAA